MTRIERSAQADADLKEIWQYLAAESEVAADRVAAGIVHRWRQLALNPYSGPRRDDISPGLHHLVYGPYLILYRVLDNHVEIVRIVHGSRQLRNDEPD